MTCGRPRGERRSSGSTESKPALRRAGTYGDGWLSIGRTPDGVAAGLAEVAAAHGRPTPTATVVAPELDVDPGKAAARLAEYAEVGTERVILTPTGPDWRRDYERGAALLAAL